MGFQDSFQELVIDPLRVIKATQYPHWTYEEFDGHILDQMKNGQTRCDTEELALYYCYTYMHMHYSQYAAMINHDLSGDRAFDKHVFGNADNVMMIDFGCGPMTSLLALLEHYHASTGKKISVGYIGVDYMEPMLNIGNRILNRSNLHTNNSIIMTEPKPLYKSKQVFRA